MKIILSGGGTLGPVTPLLAIASAYKSQHPYADFIWLGTKNGPEKKLVIEAGIKFIAIPSGKLRRYFSLSNFTDIFKLISAYFFCLNYLKQEKPDLLISAGGFVSVPLHLAAGRLKIPCWIHQQDNIAGLANKIMSKSANLITVAMVDSLKYFPKHKTRWIGNPVREMTINNIQEAKQYFNIKDDKPIIFALGGGTGSDRLNQIVYEALPHLPSDWYIIHLVGVRRNITKVNKLKNRFTNYRPYDFFGEEMSLAYTIADVVVGRGGFGTLTELASLSKTAVIIPISHSHQEANINPLLSKRALIKIDEQSTEAGLKLANILVNLITDISMAKQMGEVLHQALPIAKNSTICEIIDELALS